MKKGIEKRLNENHFPSIVDNIFRHEKRSKMSANNINDDEISAFIYGIWLTVKTVEAEIQWDLWINLILLVNLFVLILSTRCFGSKCPHFWSKW